MTDLWMHCQRAWRVFVLGQVQFGYAFASLLLPPLDVVERLQTQSDGMLRHAAQRTATHDAVLDPAPPCSTSTRHCDLAPAGPGEGVDWEIHPLQEVPFAAGHGVCCWCFLLPI